MNLPRSKGLKSWKALNLKKLVGSNLAALQKFTPMHTMMQSKVTYNSYCLATETLNHWATQCHTSNPGDRKRQIPNFLV